MGIIKAFSGAIKGTYSDQWKEIITAAPFDEHSAVVPGVLKNISNGYGANLNPTNGVISNGSRIYVPENTAAFIFSQSGIEDIIMEAGGFVYQDGTASVFNGDGIKKSIFREAKKRIGYGGISPEEKKIAFVNCREIRNIRFGTRGAQVYHDLFYGTDLEVFAYGSFSVQVIDPVRFIRCFVPANYLYYSFDNSNVRAQIISDFLQSFITSLNALSKDYRISQLPSQAGAIAGIIAQDQENAGSWPDRFGFRLIKVSIENIEFSDGSRELVRMYSENRMRMKVYEDVSHDTVNKAMQQTIAEGIQTHGFGDVGGSVLAMNLSRSVTPGFETGSNNNSGSSESFERQRKQIETLKELKTLLDEGVLTEEEFAKAKATVLEGFRRQ